MHVMTYTNARQNFAKIMKSANSNHTPVHVTQKSGDDVVIVSKADFDAIQETMHLLTSPVNAQRLNESVQELNAGGGQERDLIEE